MKRFELPILLIILFIMNFWFLQKNYMVTWDTQDRFEMFYFFYNNFFFHGTIAQWIPYYSFGIPSNTWQLFMLTPVSYFMMVVGKLFSLTDVYMVFKWTVFGEQVVYLLGVYLLSSQLFRDRLTVFIICLASMASSYWYIDIDFAFLMYYMFPLVGYFLVRFIEEKRPEFFWVSGLMFIAWAMGNTTYFIFIWIPFLILFLLLLVFNKLIVLKSLFEKSFRNISTLILFLFITFSFFFQFVSFGKFADIVSRPEGVKVDIKMFLTWGTGPHFERWFQDFVYGTAHDIYLGILIVLALIWGVYRVRSQNFMALFLCAIGVLWITFGGWGAFCLYFFPGVSYYRHIGYLYGFLEIFLLFVAGFGLDYFWDVKSKDQIKLMVLGLGIIVICSDGFGFSQSWLLSHLRNNSYLINFSGEDQWNSPFFRLAGYYLAFVLIVLAHFIPKDNIRRIIVKVVLFLALCFDIGAFGYLNAQSIMNNGVVAKQLEYTFKVHREHYQEKRSSVMDKRALDVLNVLSGSGYMTKYSVTQSEPCQTTLRIDFQPKATKNLQNLRQNQKEDLNKIEGCIEPKLRLVSTLMSYHNIKDIANLPEWFDRAIIKDIKGGNNAKLITSQDLPKDSFIHVTNFIPDEITMQVNAPLSGAWLVYADSYHPGWHATVNNKHVQIENVYLAFKAVYVKGLSTVKFYFKDGLNYYCSYLNLFLSMLLVVFLITTFFRILLI